MHKETRYDAFAIGNRVYNLRIQQRQGTQERVAEALEISSRTYSRIECGKYKMSVDLILRAAEYYDVSVDYLLLGHVTDMRDLQALKTDLPSIDRICETLHQIIK